MYVSIHVRYPAKFIKITDMVRHIFFQVNIHFDIKCSQVTNRTLQLFINSSNISMMNVSYLQLTLHLNSVHNVVVHKLQQTTHAQSLLPNELVKQIIPYRSQNSISSACCCRLWCMFLIAFQHSTKHVITD